MTCGKFYNPMFLFFRDTYPKETNRYRSKISNLCWYSGVHVIGPPRLEVSATPPFAQKEVGISPVKEFEIFVLAKYSLTLVTSIISHTYVLRSLSYI